MGKSGELDYFKLMRRFWNYAFENPEKIKPIHVAIYSFAVEHCNRLGWKQKFGFPTMMVCEAIGIKSVTTFSKALNELVEMGVITLVERSKNQWSANIIALSNNGKHVESTLKALDRARGKHTQEHVESTLTIIKHNTINPIQGELDKKNIPPAPIFITDIQPEQRRAVIMQHLTDTSLTDSQKKIYMLKIEANAYSRPQGGKQIPITIASIRADAELNASRGYLKTSNDTPDQSKPLPGGYWEVGT
jgi:hypothetical protein